MQVLFVTFMLFYYVTAAVPFYPSNDYNSETICLEAQNSGWSSRISGCPPPAPLPSPFYPDCDTCSGNQGYVQETQQGWSSYTKICVSRKNVCLKRCQWNVQCRTQCHMQFPCSFPPLMRSNVDENVEPSVKCHACNDLSRSN